MARVTHVKSAQQRYRTVPVLNEDGTQKTTPVMRKNGEPKLTKTGRPVVRKITVEDKSQPLPNRNCEKCGNEITVGSSYKWVAPKSGPYGGSKRFRCAACPAWTQSELSSSKMAAAYAAQESAHASIDALATPETAEDADSFLAELVSILSDAASEANDCLNDYQEGLDNMPENLQYGPTGELIQEKIDVLESWASDMEYFTGDDFVSSIDPAETFDCPECGEAGVKEDPASDICVCNNEACEMTEFDDPIAASLEDELETWAEEQKDEARSLIDALEA